MHPVVEISKKAVEAYVRDGVVIPAPADLPAELRGRAGVFVSLKKGGTLRGCIGTIEPCCENLAEEAIANAISSAVRDPRFLPVRESELAKWTYSVDVLSEPEPINGLGELDPKQYGVVVEQGNRRGLLLPDLEGVETAEQQVTIARLKAGIGPDEPVQLYRFRVERFK
ncbi:MAG: AmmeMemoRadiSam system protein A [Chloroflexota bacterium]|nr:AmmeMemoRadiSam system protein A [Chloroflexota bacterium]